jgi:hypothetical protein
MATAVQCLLRNVNIYTTRWVVAKKAKKSEKLVAQSMSLECEEEWIVDVVYDKVEVDEKFHYHVIK